MPSSPGRVLFSLSPPKAWSPAGCSRVPHHADTALGDATLLQCERRFKPGVEEEVRGGPTPLSPNPNGVHSDPVSRSCHTLNHKQLCSSPPHLHGFRCVRQGEGRGDHKGSPLCLKLATGLPGDHENMRILGSQQLLSELVNVLQHLSHGD